jgi:glycosyltransferase involved in cell wall biosynthesis
MTKLRVVFFLHQLQHYRVPIINLLTEKYDVVVYCSNADKYLSSSTKFKVEFINIISVFGGSFHNPRLFISAIKEADVVISLLNIRCFDVVLLSLLPRKVKVILWGIGVSGSYTKKFNEKSTITRIKAFIAKRVDAVIFYTTVPVNYYISQGVKKEKIFVAHNTISNYIDTPSDNNRRQFLFVGTLYKEKGLFELLKSYNNAFDKIGSKLLPLTLIGDGDLLLDIKEFLTKNKLSHKVDLLGAVYDRAILNFEFSKSVACISPNQAGLSVLDSMSNGVPFITKKTAITGGEITNIEHSVNGLLVLDDNDITDVFISASLDRERFLSMGRNALQYYQKYRTPENMANGLSCAVEEAINGN